MTVTINKHITTFSKKSNNKTALLLGLLSLFFVGLFLRLSQWQFSRAEYKTNLINRINQQVVYANPSQITRAPEYSVIKLTGNFDHQHSILLANQFYKHQTGFHILTPFIIKQAPGNNKNSLIKSILVNRGWVTKDSINTKLDHLFNTTSQTATITGVIRNQELYQYIMGDNLTTITTKSNRKINQIQKIELNNPDFEKLFPYQLLPRYIQLLSPNHAFQIDWQWTTISAEKHQAYAIQWLLLAITVILLYSYFCYKSLYCKK